jgi:hypothetical protein
MAQGLGGVAGSKFHGRESLVYFSALLRNITAEVAVSRTETGCSGFGHQISQNGQHKRKFGDAVFTTSSRINTEEMWEV